MASSPADNTDDDSLDDDDARGRFCPWYALADIAERAPAMPGVFQIKRARGLQSDPGGKSAMLRYGHSAVLASALAREAARLADHPQADSLVCRHQIVADADAAEQLYRTVLDQFVNRFGGPPTLPADLERHICLTLSYARGRQNWRFKNPSRQVDVPITGKLRANNSEVLREAAIGGTGVILMPTWLVGGDIRVGRLCPLLTEWEASLDGTKYGIHAVYLPNRRGSRKVRAFIDFLTARFGTPPYWDRAI